MTTARKVIFRQCGGESSSRTVKSGHRAIRADQYDLNVWQLTEIEELCQTDDQGVLTHHMSAIICTRDPDARTTPAGDNDVASTRSRKTTAKNSIGRRRNCNISPDKPSHVIVSVQEW